MPLNQGNSITSRGELEVSTGVVSRLVSGWAVDVLGRRGFSIGDAPASANRIAGRAFTADGKHYAVTSPTGTTLRGGIRYTASGAMLVTGAAPTASSRMVRDEFGAFLVSADGAVHVYGAERMTLPGSAGNYASTPDSTQISITGSFDVRAFIAMNDWTPAASSGILGRDTGGQFAFDFRVQPTGVLRLRVSANGTTTPVSVTSSVAVPFTDGATGGIRATYDATTGQALFFTSTDFITWTALGTAPAAPGATAVFDSNIALAIGADSTGATNTWAGNVYRVQLFDGIDGTLVADFNPNDYESGSTFVSRTTGETWTLNGTAAIAIGN